MKKSHKVSFVLLAVIVLAVVGFKAMQPKEPEYQGRRLSDWIADLNEPPPKNTEAEKVIKEIPEQVLPFVEQRILRNRDPIPEALSANERFLMGIQNTIFGKRYSSEYQWAANFEALRILDTNSLPVLERLLFRPESHSTAANLLANMDAIEVLTKGASTNQLASTRWNAINAFGGIPGRKIEATDVLVPYLQDSNEGIAIAAISSIGDLQCRPEVVVPQLCNLLDKKSDLIAYNAAYALARYGTNAMMAIPVLQKMKASGSMLLQNGAEAALQQIAPGQTSNIRTTP